MLRIRPNDRHRDGDGLTRRSFLEAGFLGLGCLGLADALRIKAEAVGPAHREAAVILIWLDGGPPHIDTYDLKPAAPAEYRGPFEPAHTNVAGIEICDLMPCQARIMDKLAIVRSLTHSDGGHTTGAHWMLTGYQLPANNREPMEPLYPSMGSITAKLCGDRRRGLPAYVGVPFAATDVHVPGYHGAAYLGGSHNPFQLFSDPNTADFGVQNLTLPDGITLQRLDDRKKLLSSFDTLRSNIDRSGTLQAMDQFQRQAYELVTGPLARQAFDISQEDPRLRDRYGRNTWGQSCLLARRLVEAGVTFVTVRMDGWDDHGRSHPQLRGKLPNLDQAVAALVEDLAARGLYEQVAICMFGEFGRTPRINENAGRDHWPQAGFCLLGGAGLKTGLVVGATNDKGEYPKDRPVSPGDVLATLYYVLGIDTSRTFTDHAGRPHPILPAGAPIAELI